MQKEWKQRLSHSEEREKETEVKAPVHVTIKVSQAIKDILKMRERDGSTNAKLLGIDRSSPFIRSFLLLRAPLWCPLLFKIQCYPTLTPHYTFNIIITER